VTVYFGIYAFIKYCYCTYVRIVIDTLSL